MKAMVAGLMAVMCLYLLTNVSYHAVLSYEEFTSSNAVALVGSI